MVNNFLRLFAYSLARLLFLLGAAITSTLIALIANAGPEDQAIATAGTVVY